ncbi:MAG: methyltransferase family protein [Minisyncoccia bacterium]
MKPEPVNIPKTAHAVLTESYLVYVIVAIPALIVSAFYPTATGLIGLMPLGVLLLLLAPILILWAQNASEHFRDKKNINDLTPSDFMHGPYKFIRFPTHLGLFLLMVGLSIVIGSFVVFCGALFAQIISHLVFLPNEDKLLVEKYGDPYRGYKKIVRLSI